MVALRRCLACLAMLLLSISPFVAFAQLPDCNGGDPKTFYFLNQNGIYEYNPDLPAGPGNPRLNNITPLAGGLGLAISRNLNAGTPPMTFYTVRNGEYYYSDGNNWVATGHSAGTNMAINIGAGGGYIFSLEVLTNTIYRYDGTGNAIPLITIPGAINGIADLVVDCKGNFYVLNTAAGQYLRKYDPNGVLVHSWSLTGIPQTSGGGGFAIIGQSLYYSNNAHQFFKGTINCNTVDFQAPLTEPWTMLPTDMAECSPCNIDFQPVNEKHFFCAGTNIQFTSGGFGPYSWTILHGTPTISMNGSVFHISAPGTATVVLHSSSVCGTKNDTIAIMIPSVVLEPTPRLDTIAGCGQYLDTLHASLHTDTTGGIAYAVQWQPISGILSGATTLHPVVSPAANTIYTITVTTPANQGGCVWKDSVRVTVADRTVVADFTPDISYGCSQDTVLFSNLSSGATQHSWSFGDGNMSSSVNPQHIYALQGSYAVQLISTNGFCADTVVKVLDLQHQLNAFFVPERDTLCEGGTVLFSNHSTYDAAAGAAAWQWFFGDAATDTAKSPVHQYASDGSFTAMLVVTDFRGCSDTAQHLIQVDPMPSVVTSVTDSILCAGEEASFQAVYTQTGNTGISWDLGGSDIVNQPSVIRSFREPGTYPVGFRADYRACPDILSGHTINVSPVPAVSLGPDTTICREVSSFMIGDSSSSTPANISWTWNTGATSAFINAHEAGIYVLRASLDECIASDTIVVQNNTCDCQVVFPDVFTPNGDGRNDLFRAVTANDCGIRGFELSVYNRWGQRVFHSFDPRSGWDGAQAESGSYRYMARYTSNDQSRSEMKAGDILLVR